MKKIVYKEYNAKNYKLGKIYSIKFVALFFLIQMVAAEGKENSFLMNKKSNSLLK